MALANENSPQSGPDRLALLKISGTPTDYKCANWYIIGGGGLNIPEGDQIFKAMSEILGPVGPNISTTTEIFGPGGQNIMGDQISCDSACTAPRPCEQR